MDYVHNVRICSNHVADYFSDIAPLAKQSLSITVQALSLYIRLVATTLRPFLTLSIYLYHLLTPPLSALLGHLVTALMLQPRQVVIAELSISAIALLLLALETRYAFIRRSHYCYLRAHARMTRRFHRIVAHVRVKSRLAASVLPHLLFSFFATVFHLTIAQFCLPLTRGPGLITIACVRPAFHTLALLYAVDVDPPPSHIAITPSTPGTSRDHDSHASTSTPPHTADADATVLIKTATTTPSDSVRRRRRGSSPDTMGVDSVRRRAASVAAQIENEAHPDQPSARRVRIDETPYTMRFLRSTSALLSSARSARSPGSDVDSMGSDGLRDHGSDARRARHERSVLRFWVLFGTVWGARSLMWFVSPSFLESVVCSVDIGMFYFFVWAQFSLTMGADLVYPPFAAFLQRRGISRASVTRAVTSSVDGAKQDETVQQLGLIMRLLTSLRVFDALKSGRTWRFVSESGFFIVLMCVFALVPRMIAFLMALVAGVLLPCVWSTNILESDETDTTSLQRHNWLAYWGVFSLVDAAYAAGADSFGWLPFWYHVKVVIILWLQVPNFFGAVQILDGFMNRVGFALSTVKKQTVTPRKRKRG